MCQQSTGCGWKQLKSELASWGDGNGICCQWNFEPVEPCIRSVYWVLSFCSHNEITALDIFQINIGNWTRGKSLSHITAQDKATWEKINHVFDQAEAESRRQMYNCAIEMHFIFPEPTVPCCRTYHPTYSNRKTDQVPSHILHPTPLESFILYPLLPVGLGFI